MRLWLHCYFIFFSQGDKKRAERATLNSADGDTGEYHDQFYRDHKLLLVLFRVLAVMPITRSSPGKSIRMPMLNGHSLHSPSFSFRFLLSRLRKSHIQMEIVGHNLCNFFLHRNDGRRILRRQRTHSHSRRNEEIWWKNLCVHFCHIFGATFLDSFCWLGYIKSIEIKIKKEMKSTQFISFG